MNSASIKDTKKEEESNQKNLDNQLLVDLFYHLIANKFLLYPFFIFISF